MRPTTIRDGPRRSALRDVLARPGAFGENLSTPGITERDVCVGDVFTLGVGGAALRNRAGRGPYISTMSYCS